MYCSKCGKQIKDESKYCPYCGNKLSKGLSTSSLTAEAKKDIKKIWIVAIVIVCLIALSFALSKDNDFNINININSDSPKQEQTQLFPSTPSNKYAGLYDGEDTTVLLAKDNTYIFIDKTETVFKAYEVIMGTYTAEKDVITLYYGDSIYTYFNYSNNNLIGADLYTTNIVYKNIGKGTDIALSENPNVKKLIGKNYVGSRDTYSFINDSEVLLNGTKVNYRNTENIIFINEVSYKFDFINDYLVLIPFNSNAGKYFVEVEEIDVPNDEFSNDEGRGDSIPMDDDVILSPEDIPASPEGPQSYVVEYSD